MPIDLLLWFFPTPFVIDVCRSVLEKLVIYIVNARLALRIPTYWFILFLFLAYVFFFIIFNLFSIYRLFLILRYIIVFFFLYSFPLSFLIFFCVFFMQYYICVVYRIRRPVRIKYSIFFSFGFYFIFGFDFFFLVLRDSLFLLLIWSKVTNLMTVMMLIWWMKNKTKILSIFMRNNWMIILMFYSLWLSNAP